MSAQINIYDSDAVINLPVGIYSIRILGGWGFRMGDFTLLLRNLSSNRVIKPKPVFMRIQSFEFGQRAKKILQLIFR